MTLTTDRPLTAPYSHEAETAVLGALLLSPDLAATEVLDILDRADFYQPNHQQVYEAITDLYAQNQPIDAVTVSNRLRTLGVFDRVGGTSYLVGLLDDVPTASNVDYYARIVRDHALRRALGIAALEIRREAADQTAEVAAVLDHAEQRVYEIGSRQAGSRARRVGPLLTDAIEAFEHAERSGLSGLRLGFADLDRKLGGVAAGNLVILAARPSVGKSALALGVAQRVAAHGAAVAFFSLEMSQRELVQRLVCATARVDSERAKLGELADKDWHKLTQAAEKLHELPLYVEDTAGMTVTELRAKARRVARDAGGLGLIIIDYLQLMTGRGDNREQEIASISRGLKALAQDLDVPVLALSQLNRAVEVRENKRPRLADLRESGSLEQDADIVMLLYRDEYYSPTTTTDAAGKAELNIAKHRTGGTGVVSLSFQASYVAFEDAIDTDRGAGYS